MALICNIEKQVVLMLTNLVFTTATTSVSGSPLRGRNHWTNRDEEADRAGGENRPPAGPDRKRWTVAVACVPVGLYGRPCIRRPRNRGDCHRPARERGGGAVEPPNDRRHDYEGGRFNDAIQPQDGAQLATKRSDLLYYVPTFKSWFISIPIRPLMTPEDLLARVEALRVWHIGAERAPHKPLLALWALGRCLRGEDRLVSYKEADVAIRRLLHRFGPHRKTMHTEAPFWRLRHDGFWEIPKAPRVTVTSKGDAHKSSLLRLDAHGGFTEAVHALLRDDERLAMRLACTLVEAHFPRTLHDEVLEAVGVEPGLVWFRRRPRNPAFSPSVLEAYSYRCAVCGFAVRSNDRSIALEAAHIKWHEASGPDEVSNGLALCALHHRLFDKGAFTVSLACRVVLARSVSGPGFEESLGRFASKPLALPKHVDSHPDPRFLQWHEREVFTSEIGVLA